MKKFQFLIVALALLSNCHPSAKESHETVAAPEIETCSMKLGNVTFTGSLNNAMTFAQLHESSLVLLSPAKSDYFNEPDGKMNYASAPMLVTQINNNEPFTFQVKVTPSFNDTYDAGALYIYHDQKRWFKFAFERDERQKTRLVTVRTAETSDDNNHDAVDSESVYLKISSGVKSIGFYYSLDKIKWQLVRVFKNEYPNELWLGVSAQSPVGKGNKVIFEECFLTDKSVKDFRLGN